jgi:hypothetical protein
MVATAIPIPIPIPMGSSAPRLLTTRRELTAALGHEAGRPAVDYVLARMQAAGIPATLLVDGRWPSS